MVDVDAVVAPVGVKIEYDVSQALVVRVEQELLEDWDELVVLAEDDPCEEDVSSSPSFSRSVAISARVSVSSSISARSGTSASTESAKLVSTLCAQLTSFATS